MMKNVRSLLAALLVLCLCFSACSFVSAEESTEDPVLAVYNGVEYTQSMVENYMMYLYYYGYVDDMTDYRSTLNYILQVEVLDDKLVELGYYYFTEEEEEAFLLEAKAQIEADIEDYVSYYLSEDTEEARAELRAQAEEIYAGSEEEYVDELEYNAASDSWLASLQVAEVTDEMIESTYQSYCEEDEEYFAGNIAMYEYYRDYRYYDSFYTPEGYRSVKCIVLTADEELLSAWVDAEYAYEDGADGDDAEALRAAADAAKEAVLAAAQADIDAVQQELANGADFDSVCEKYSIDENVAMNVHKESIVYDYTFIEAAFSDTLQAIGDVTGPVLTSDGILFIQYADDVKAGPIELTDELRADLRSLLESTAQSDAASACLEQYMAEADITYYEEAIAAAEAAATEE